MGAAELTTDLDTASTAALALGGSLTPHKYNDLLATALYAGHLPVGDATTLDGHDSSYFEKAFAAVPIGVILPFHPNIASPALSVPANFAPCNGATISDTESPLNGRTLPNLNGSAYGSSGRGRYLRGGSTSGLLNGSTYKLPGGSDNVYGGSGGYYGAWVYTYYGLDGDASGAADRINYSTSKASVTFTNTPYQVTAMTVVFIMRIK